MVFYSRRNKELSVYSLESSDEKELARKKESRAMVSKVQWRYFCKKLIDENNHKSAVSLIISISNPDK